jgi:outer membrane receptor protein involved in Fe transport
MRFHRTWLVALVLPLLMASVLVAQGIPTSTISGRVISEGQGLPGVTVTAKSPALQGVRTAVTSTNGDYIFPGVPPGDYTVSFTMSGFQTVTRTVKANSSQVVNVNTAMDLAGVAAEAVVVAQTESISQQAQQATTYSNDLLAKLPTLRNINSAVVLSPGLNQNGPNGVSIAGAQSTENLYTVNGVVITDNVRSTANNLFIEDAIQETTTITSSVSAEYGRFTGGVINTITKSGGNSFSGSFRTTLTNDNWNAYSGYRTSTGVNPQEGTFVDKITPTYEATFGGPILKDKVWFFGAGRFFDTTGDRSTVTRQTNIPVTFGDKETRWEAKLTVSPLQNHTVTGSYIKNDRDQVNYWYDTPADVNVFYDRSTPQDIMVVNYNGVLTNNLFVDGFYSKRQFTFENAGGKYTDLVRGTPIKDQSLGVVYNSPTFCGVCSPETRDNDDYVLKATYFLSTKSLGTHNIVVGYDDFGGQRKSNNYQSGSNFTLYTYSDSIVNGQNIYPVFEPGTSSYVVYWPILQLSQGNDLRTRSLFINDTWRVNNNLSFNVGVRYDKNKATDQGGNTTSDDDGFSPRLAGTYDVFGDGKLRVAASYAKYVGALQDTQAGSGATMAGSPAIFYWYYDGPGINTDPSQPLVSPADAVQKWFDWFASQGCMPDPTAAGCQVPLGGPPSVSGVNIQIQESLKSPYSNEYVLGVAGAIGSRGSFRADFVRREYGNFYDLLKDTTTGQVTSPVNADAHYDLGLIVNSDDYTREYTGLHSQFAYRIGDRLNIGGNWTWSHLIGDIVGESAGSSVTRGGLHAYPEYFDRSWNAPVGSLGSDTRHRVRVYGSYDVPVPSWFGYLNLGFIQSWDTGTPYGEAAAIQIRQFVTNPGYLTTPASVTYWFTGRDEYRTEDVYSTDLSLTYSHKIAGGVELYVTPRVTNIFNQQAVINVNTTVNTAATQSYLLPFDPFSGASPIECPAGSTAGDRDVCRAMNANFQKGVNFGKPTSAAMYQATRSFQISVGLRF